MSEFNVMPAIAYFLQNKMLEGIKQDQYLQWVSTFPNGANMDVIQPILMFDLAPKKSIYKQFWWYFLIDDVTK